MRATSPEIALARVSETTLGAPPGLHRLAAGLLGFAPIVYLGLSGGGYDAAIRGEVGIAAWWVVIAGLGLGVLPAASQRRAALVLPGLLLAFAIWTGTSMLWSGSAERSLVEATRVAILLGFLLLGISAVSRATAGDAMLGAAAAVALVSGLGVASRIEPSWFPTNDILEFFPGSERRLAYPLNSPNAVGEFAALGLPLLFGATAIAKRIAAQAAFAAAVPVCVLCAVLSQSRGGAVVGVVGVLVLLALRPQRFVLLCSGAITAAGAGILLVALARRDAVRDGISGELAAAQSQELTGLIIAVSLGVALGHAAVVLVQRHANLPRMPAASPLLRATAIAALAAAALGAGIATELPQRASDRWSEFKQPAQRVRAERTTSLASRFRNVGGSHRYQYWSSAVRAGKRDPLTGIGAGGFELWWARDRDVSESVRDAHSLYAETFAELGVPGLLLLVAFLGGALALGVRGALSSRGSTTSRVVSAAATAGLVAFSVAAAVDWVWEVTVLPVAAMLLVALIVGAYAEPRSREPIGWPKRAGIIALALASIALIAHQLAQTRAIRDSRAAARAGELQSALTEARSAVRVAPFAASGHLQEALVLEALGRPEEGRVAIARAVDAEPANWRLWLVRSRIELAAGNARAGTIAFRRVRELNPLTPVVR